MKRIYRALIFGVALLAPAAASAERSFASPEEGASALVAALQANSEPALRGILGRRGFDLIGLRKRAGDDKPHERFLAAYAAAHRLVRQGDAKAVLEVGVDAWPFPIPLVKAAGGWRFDAVLGEREVLARRIGRNELAAIEVCRAIGDAERDYAAAERDGDMVLRYAARLASSPRRHDGLYWESASGDLASPLGPFVAAAGIDPGARRSAPPRIPYHGYFYRILNRQGAHAKGGAYSYVEGGRMIGGFAVLAFPARYGATGRMTFMVSRDGDVFEKDLGAATAAAARLIRSFDPGPGWARH